MSRYEGVDFYKMEQHLTEEEIMVRDLVRDWVDEKVIPIIEEYYTKGTFPTDLISETMMANDAISQNELKDVVTLVIYNSSGTPVKTLYGAGS